jgi:hypothetical protein
MIFLFQNITEAASLLIRRKIPWKKNSLECRTAENLTKMMEFHTFSELFANIPVSWKII